MKHLPIFYAPPSARDGDEISLDKTETRHLSKVMRLKKADLVMVVDGLGLAYRGEVSHLTGQKCTVRIHSTIRNFGEPTVRLTLAAALSTSTKFDTVVQKGTELGVKRFVPILSKQGTVKAEDPARIRRKITRLESVALASIKQCGRAYRPDIASPTKLDLFLKETDRESLNLIFQPDDKGLVFANLELDQGKKRVTILIGPEAGFAPEEVDAAVEAGFQALSLGSRILRTETAGPVAVALVMNALGDFT